MDGCPLRDHSRLSPSPLGEEGLEKRSSEFLSRLTCFIQRKIGRPERQWTALGPRGLLIIRVNPSLSPSKSRITINTGGFKSRGHRTWPGAFLTDLIRRAILCRDRTQADTWTPWCCGLRGSAGLPWRGGALSCTYGHLTVRRGPQGGREDVAAGTSGHKP